MNTTVRIATVLIFATSLAACAKQTPAPASAPSGTEPKTMIGKAVEGAIDKARRELSTQNIGLSNGVGRPKAEITPQGDLLIDGKATTIDAKQRALLLEHRKQVVAIAEAGMTVGVQGADLAGKALNDAIGSIFSGDTEQMEKKIEAEAKEIEKAAVRLCDRLPGLLASQQALAQALPAFAPYATMTEEDVKDCLSGDSDGGEAVGKAIENAFNGRVKVELNTDGASNDGKNAAEEAEAAGAADAAKTAESQKR